MSFSSLLSDIFNYLLKKIFALEENKSLKLGEVEKILLVCPHFTLNELISSTSLYRAIKEKYPVSDLTVVVGSKKFAELKNNLIDEFIVCESSELLNQLLVISFLRKLKNNFDVCIVPVTESLSSKSDYLARLSKSKIRVGVNSFDGKANKTNYCFDRRIDLNYCKHPDTNISERVLDIIKPFGIDTKDLSTQLIISETELDNAKNKLSKIKKDLNTNLIGINVTSEDSSNTWSLKNYIALIEKLNKDFICVFYFISSAYNEEVKFIQENIKIPISIIEPKSITEAAAIILLSDLFVTNDSSLMHIASTTTTPQVSLFGKTNPFNWAPCGKNKIFLQKSDLIDDITVDEVFDVCKVLLKESK